MHCTVMHCTVLPCTSLFYAVLYRTEQHSATVQYHGIMIRGMNSVAFQLYHFFFISLLALFLPFLNSFYQTFPLCVQSVLLQTKLEEVTWHISETTFEFCASHAEVDMMKSKGGKSHPSSRRSQVHTSIISQTFHVEIEVNFLCSFPPFFPVNC